MKNTRKAKAANKIPPPPGPTASYDELITYHSKHSLDELEHAGYAEEVPPQESEDLAASAAFWSLCRNGLHLKLTRKEYEELARLAARQDVGAEELARQWVKERLVEHSKARDGRKH